MMRFIEKLDKHGRPVFHTDHDDARIKAAQERRKRKAEKRARDFERMNKKQGD